MDDKILVKEYIYEKNNKEKIIENKSWFDKIKEFFIK